MGRVLHKAPIGLHLAWLSHHAESKVEHDRAKHTLAGHEGEDARASGRDTFRRLAETKQGTFREILDEESRASRDPRERAVDVD